VRVYERSLELRAVRVVEVTGLDVYMGFHWGSSAGPLGRLV
jgi:hypothetical protein